MNSLIEDLNGWGESLLSVVWPMFWQSSLLIAVMFALDFLLAKKIRASVRHAMWLMVLVKLILPPTLALPTSPAWWLTPKKPVEPPPVAKHFTVTFNDAAPLEVSPATIPLTEQPAPELNWLGWCVLFSGVVSLALFSWLVFRWMQITRIVGHAASAENLNDAFAEAGRLAGAPVSDPACRWPILKRAGSETGVPLAPHRVRLKIVECQMSPAVCGLFRPVILLPRALAENLSATQLRAVLLHEIFHLRRRDIWVNCAQALLQIVYWWHPLLWFANARIRRVREEAVDDAVMLALRDEGDSYAPTLLEVAKLALRRPLMSLGLVGIMESRSALRQRVERLLDFHAPRHAGLTIFSVLGIVAFSAVAVPMGEAPEKNLESKKMVVANDSEPYYATSGRGENRISLPRTALLPPPTNPASILIQAEIFQISAMDFSNVLLKAVLDPKTFRGAGRLNQQCTLTSRRLADVRSTMRQAGFQSLMRPRLLTASGKLAQISVGDETRGTELNCTPAVIGEKIRLEMTGKVDEPAKNSTDFGTFVLVENQGGVLFRSRNADSSSVSNYIILLGVEMVTNSPQFQPQLQSVVKPANGALTNASFGRQNLSNQLNRIRLDSVTFERVPLSEVLRQLTQKTRLADPEHKGINFLINPNVDQSGAVVNSPGFMPKDSQATNGRIDVGALLISIEPPLTNVSLTDVLKAVVQQSPQPMHYTLHDYGVVFSPGAPLAMPPKLFVREFKVDTNIFPANLGLYRRLKTSANAASDITRAVCRMFTNSGVNLSEPAGKAVVYNGSKGNLLVRATAADFDLIERLIQSLNSLQIHIKARFISIPKKDAWTLLLSPEEIMTMSATNTMPEKTVKILPDDQFRTVLKQLESRKSFENLGEPELVEMTGRHAQIRVTEIQTIVTNVVFQETATNYGPVPQTTTVETGPMLDVVSHVMADGYTINLTLMPSLTEFLGYEKSTNTTTTHNRAGQKIELPKILPRFATRQVSATANLWDNQTVVLGGLNFTNTYTSKSKVPVLGDIQVLGHLFRSQHKTEVEKEVLVFVTATIIDPVGNRVYRDEDLPFAKNFVPSQPTEK